MKTLHRLNEGQYREIEKKAQVLLVNGTTTELSAGFILGQQSILKILRDGWTITA